MAITNVNLYYTAGSATGTSAQELQLQGIQETYARRLISRNLKIISGTMTWAASSLPGCAGESFDYEKYGDRFLWMGFSPRVTVVNANSQCYMPLYDPSTRKIHIIGSPGSTTGLGTPLAMIDADRYPAAAATFTTGFCLLMTESAAGSGIGA